MSQENVPDTKPHFSLRFFSVAIAASGISGIIAGLIALAMLLVFFAGMHAGWH